jgi:hypothetical protein
METSGLGMLLGVLGAPGHVLNILGLMYFGVAVLWCTALLGCLHFGVVVLWGGCVLGWLYFGVAVLLRLSALSTMHNHALCIPLLSYPLPVRATL